MIRQIVISSELRSIGYVPERAMLEVEFQSGGVYQYFGVPEVVFAGLVSASSKGRYFNANIREVYFYRRIQ